MKSYKLTHYILGAIGLIGLIAVLIFDLNNSDRSIIEEDLPRYNLEYIIRSFIILFSLNLLILGFLGTKRPKFNLFDNSIYGLKLPLSKKKLSLQEISVLLVYSMSLVFLITGVISQRIFNWLSFEDNLLEWLSALALLLASIILFISWLMAIKKNLLPILSKTLVILLSLLLFVIGMEEVSWFQRIIGFETPGGFNNNIQDEFNLHNFATSTIENAYYFGAFIYLILIPFISIFWTKFISEKELNYVIPRIFSILVAAAAYSYNFDMWNIYFSQVTFYGSIVILCMLASFVKINFERKLIYCLVLFLIVQQIVFIINPGIIMVEARNWTLTEYKEFFIPVAFLAYSIDVYLQLKQKANFARIQ